MVATSWTYFLKIPNLREKKGPVFPKSLNRSLGLIPLGPRWPRVRDALSARPRLPVPLQLGGRGKRGIQSTRTVRMEREWSPEGRQPRPQMSAAAGLSYMDLVKDFVALTKLQEANLCFLLSLFPIVPYMFSENASFECKWLLEYFSFYS